MRCREFDLEVPDSFPLAAWEEFYRTGMKAGEGNGEAQDDFNRAMGCVLFRYKTCDESIKSMGSSWVDCGRVLDSYSNYSLHRDIFTFFICGLSCLESLLYGVYVVATQ